MHLIFIYGPPAVGKLTVAQELAQLTGYPVFHLHQTIDLVTQFFPQGTAAYSQVTRIIRLAIIQAAAQEQFPGLIFTYGYGNPTKQMDEFIKTIIQTIHQYGGTTNFVYLTADKETLFERVTQASRKNTGKIQTKEILAQTLQERTFGEIPFVENFVIDTTHLSAEQVAQQIKKHYKL